MRKLRVGVVGVGFIGRAHLDAIRRIPDAEVVALAHSNLDVARREADALGVPAAYADYHDLVSDPNVEVVHNCTPNHLHFEVNAATLEAGKACFSEKPLTTTTAEAQTLVDLVTKTGAPAGVNFNHRAFPQVQEARAMLAGGDLGAVFAVHGSYLQDWLLFDHDWNWRLDPGVGGASRAVADIGSHWMDLAQHVIGSPIVEVLGDLATVVPVRYAPEASVGTFQTGDSDGRRTPVNIQTEDFASVLLRLANGAHGAFSVSQVSAGRKNQLTIEVDAAREAIAWNSEDAEHLWIGSRTHANSVWQRDPAVSRVPGVSRLPAGHAEGWFDALYNAVRGFYAAVRGEQVPWVGTFEDGLRSVQLTEAILRSSQSRRWVELSPAAAQQPA